MRKRFCKIGLALAVLALALAGCKNGLLTEDEATVNGTRFGGSRTATVSVSNFQTAGDGKLRTITADKVDLTTQADKYYYLVTATARGFTAVEKVVTLTNGSFNLPDLDPAIWNIKLEAFEKAAAEALGAAAGTPTEDQLKAATAALAMVGTGVADLVRADAPVVITLSSKGVAGNGKVTVKVNLNQSDKDTIAKAPGEYTVDFGIYDKITGADILPGGATSVETKDGNAVATTVTYEKTDVPAGEYLFRITIKRTGGNPGTWYWSDTLLVEPNITMDYTANPHAIIDKAPEAPVNFKIYHANDTYTNGFSENEYTVRLAWDRKSYSEEYFTIQFYDVTDLLNDEFTQWNGADTVATSEDIWGKIDAATQTYPNTITVGKDYPRTEYPRYKQGSLLAGNTYADYILETGKKYVVRIQSNSGGSGSEWVYAETGGDPNTAKWANPTSADNKLDKFTTPALNMFAIRYDLTGYKIIQNGHPDTDKITGKLEVVARDTVSNTNISYLTNYILYREGVSPSTPNASDTDTARIIWDGWKDSAGTIYKTGNTTYNGTKNIILKPNITSSSNATVTTLSGGTYKDMFGAEDVFAKLHTGATGVTFQTNDALDSWQVATGGQAPGAEGVSSMGTPKTFIVNRDFAGGNNHLVFSVGKMDQGAFSPGILDIPGGTETVKITSATYTVKKNDGTISRTVSGTPEAGLDISGLIGDFTLFVEIRTATTYPVTWQTPFIIKDKDDPNPTIP